MPFKGEIGHDFYKNLFTLILYKFVNAYLQPNKKNMKKDRASEQHALN